MKRYAFDVRRGEMFEIASGAYVEHREAERLQAEVERVKGLACATAEAADALRGKLAAVRARACTLLREGADAVERASNEAADGRISGDTWEALHAWLVRVHTELEGE